MPPPVVRSPLGPPLGDRGLLPLPDALPAAGVVAGGPYTVSILKGCLNTVTGVSSRTGAHRGGGGGQSTNFSTFHSTFHCTTRILSLDSA